MRALNLLLVGQLAWSLSSFAADKSFVSDPTEANIARVSARILEQSHYLQHPFDDEISSKFLDRYLDTLDGGHIYFLQSDLADFERYRHSLDDLTLKGDTAPAHQIFARLIERLDERVAYAKEVLADDKFSFTSDERYTPNRRDLPWPKNVDEAHQLWRQHVRFEFLQEKLSASDAKTKAAKNGNVLSGSGKAGTNGVAAKALDPVAEIKKTITSRYTRIQKNLKQLSPDEVFEIYITALCHVYDPHSDYMGHLQLEDFAMRMRLSLFGIGALLQQDDDYCKIKELLPGPALTSKKLKVNDKIVAVAQGGKEPVDVVGMPLSKVVQLIRGDKGTEVRLTVIPVDAPDPSVRKVVPIVRAEVKLEDQEAKAKIIDLPREAGRTMRMGLIDLPSFYSDFDGRKTVGYKSTTSDVAKLVTKLKQEKVEGIILDLRRNGGGALDEAINLTGLFIKKGPVVQTKDPDPARPEILSDEDSSILYDGPLIVLTSRFSASASEILAGALQDYGRALIVGDSSTHGKGTVQTLIKLDRIMESKRMAYNFDPGALKITVRKFYRASGSSTQLKGVIPDLVLPSVNNHAEVGEQSLKFPLPWDTVDAAKYEKVARVDPYLPELKKRSMARVRSDRDYNYILEDIEQYKKLMADKSISLNEAQRLKEKRELQARMDARKKERQARKGAEEKIYDITLKNAGEIGLPSPAAKTNELAAADERLSADSEDSDLVDDHAAAVDPMLDETKRILADYAELLKKSPALSQAR